MAVAFSASPASARAGCSVPALAAVRRPLALSPSPDSGAGWTPRAVAVVAGLMLCALGRRTAWAAPRRRRGGLLAKLAERPEPEIDPRPREAPGSVPPVQMPMIDTGNGKQIDVMSKLLEDRVIMCSGPVNDETAQVLVAQMLYLAKADPDKDITMYINSPGGSVSAGMAIYDTMQLISCDVNTVCFGFAASMGAFLLGAGTKGKRRAYPNSRIMIHQPLGGAQGPAADVQIQANEILFLREILNMHLADMTGKSIEQIKVDCDRDNFMCPEEAKVYGLIDSIVETKSWPRLQKPPRPDLFDRSWPQ